MDLNENPIKRRRIAETSSAIGVASTSSPAKSEESSIRAVNKSRNPSRSLVNNHQRQNPFVVTNNLSHVSPFESSPYHDIIQERSPFERFPSEHPEQPSFEQDTKEAFDELLSHQQERKENYDSKLCDKTGLTYIEMVEHPHHPDAAAARGRLPPSRHPPIPTHHAHSDDSFGATTHSAHAHRASALVAHEGARGRARRQHNHHDDDATMSHSDDGRPDAYTARKVRANRNIPRNTVAENPHNPQMRGARGTQQPPEPAAPTNRESRATAVGYVGSATSQNGNSGATRATSAAARSTSAATPPQSEKRSQKAANGATHSDRRTDRHTVNATRSRFDNTRSEGNSRSRAQGVEKKNSRFREASPDSEDPRSTENKGRSRFHGHEKASRFDDHDKATTNTKKGATKGNAKGKFYAAKGSSQTGVVEKGKPGKLSAKGGKFDFKSEEATDGKWASSATDEKWGSDGKWTWYAEKPETHKWKQGRSWAWETHKSKTRYKAETYKPESRYKHKTYKPESRYKDKTYKPESNYEAEAQTGREAHYKAKTKPKDYYKTEPHKAEEAYYGAYSETSTSFYTSNTTSKVYSKEAREGYYYSGATTAKKKGNSTTAKGVAARRGTTKEASSKGATKEASSSEGKRMGITVEYTTEKGISASLPCPSALGVRAGPSSGVNKAAAGTVLNPLALGVRPEHLPPTNGANSIFKRATSRFKPPSENSRFAPKPAAISRFDDNDSQADSKAEKDSQAQAAKGNKEQVFQKGTKDFSKDESKASSSKASSEQGDATVERTEQKSSNQGCVKQGSPTTTDLRSQSGSLSPSDASCPHSGSPLPPNGLPPNGARKNPIRS